MFEEHVGIISKNRLSVIVFVFLIVSSGLVPAVPSGKQSIQPVSKTLVVQNTIVNGNPKEIRPEGFFNLLLFDIFSPFVSPTVTTSTAGIYAGSATGAVSTESYPASSSSQSESTVSSAEGYFTSTSTVVSMVAILPGIWDESSRKRSRAQIYVEILELLKRGPMTPFEISFYARLNHKRTKEFVRLLEKDGYIESSEEDARTIVILSEKGRTIVDKVRNLFEKDDEVSLAGTVQHDDFGKQRERES